METHGDGFMRDTDAFSWYLEEDPGLRSTIVAVAFLESAPDFDVLARRLERATRLVPRFRQRPTTPPGRLATPRWVDTDFDLGLHLQRVEAPPPYTHDTVLELARAAAMTGFDRTRPLWHFTLVEGLEGGAGALLMKVHHSLTDGIGGMQLALLLFDADGGLDAGDEVPLPAGGHRADGGIELVWQSFVHQLARSRDAGRAAAAGLCPTLTRLTRDPLGAVRDAVATAGSVSRFVRPLSTTLSPVMTGRGLDRHVDLLTVKLGDLKRAARAVDGTVNDAFMTAVTGGLRRYHEQHGAAVEELRVTLPISLRREGDDAAENRITLERFEVPVGLVDPARRLAEIGRRCRAARAERALPLSDPIAGTLNLLPTGIVGNMLKHVDFLASNVPGIGVPIFLAGAPVLGYYCFGPTTGSSANVTLITYAGVCCVGVTLDATAVPDTDLFMACLRQGFEEVLELGGPYVPVDADHPASRRRTASARAVPSGVS